MARKKIEYPGTAIPEDPQISLCCQWNDHGDICGRRGSFSESTVGGGPWYCREHWAALKGQSPIRSGIHVPYRDRWYEEQDLPYAAPKLVDVPPFRCVGGDVVLGELGKRVREPGSDDDVPQTWEGQP